MVKMVLLFKTIFECREINLLCLNFYQSEQSSHAQLMSILCQYIFFFFFLFQPLSKYECKNMRLFKVLSVTKKRLQNGKAKFNNFDFMDLIRNYTIALYFLCLFSNFS
jgi:hypothetical protein